jgi:uncharacterized protein
MKIRYINGTRLKYGLLAGIYAIQVSQKKLDRMNVFPVPDGDTGTNMATTMRGVLDALEDEHSESLITVAEVASDAALMASLGNSGSILAQFLCGISDALQGKERATPEEFVVALKNSIKDAWSALENPTEGTILTVMRDWVVSFSKLSEESKDFEYVFLNSMEEARVSLANTPEQLAVLKKAGVVDAGAQGFVDLLTGIENLIKNDKNFLRSMHSKSNEDRTNIAKEYKESVHDSISLDDLNFRFCTECIFLCTSITPIELKHKIKKFGDSIVIVGGKNKFKVHIHSNHPEALFIELREEGEVIREKAEDMVQQYKDTLADNEKSIALVSDSACDLPMDRIREMNLHIIPIKINFGEIQFIDKVTISPDQFFQNLERLPDHPKTSRPSAGDFKRTYEYLSNYYKGIIVLHLSGALSGTYDTSKQIALKISDKITVIDTRTISIGLGLVAQEVSAMIDDGVEIDEIIKRTYKCCESLKAYFSLKTFDYLVRGGRLPKIAGTIFKLIRAKPVLSLKKGKIKPVSIAFTDKQRFKKIIKYTLDAVNNKVTSRILIAYGTDRKTAELIEHELRFKHKIRSKIVLTQISSALGAHAGPTGIGIAILPKP